MNTQHLIGVSVLGFAAAAACAQEATQFSIPPSTLTRAEVKAELARAQAAGELVGSHESDWRVSHAAARQERAAPAARTRAEVRLEALVASRASTFDSSYVGG